MAATSARSISGAGAVTAGGHRLPASYAVWRAGVSRLEELPEVLVPDTSEGLVPAKGARVPEIPVSETSARLGLMGLWALEEALNEATGNQLEKTTLLYVGPAFDTDLGREALRFTAEAFRSIHGAWFGGGTIVVEGEQGLLDQVGEGPVIILAMESLLAEPSIEHLTRAGRIRSGADGSGLFPGEGAAALLLDDRKPLARISGWGRGSEPNPIGSPDPCLATGLTGAWREALDGKSASVTLVLTNMSGERYRGVEAGLARSRLFAGPRPAPDLHHTADCIGDLGRTALVLHVALAAHGLALGDLEGNVLVSHSGDGSDREAVLVEGTA